MVDLKTSDQKDNRERGHSSCAVHQSSSQIGVCESIQLDLSIATVEEKHECEHKSNQYLLPHLLMSQEVEDRRTIEVELTPVTTRKVNDNRRSTIYLAYLVNDVERMQLAVTVEEKRTLLQETKQER